MSKKEHRLGVNEINLVVRRLKLASSGASDIKAAIEDIYQCFGIDEAIFDESSSVLKLTYDATRLDIDSLEQMLEKHHVSVNDDWWTHFKESYYRFVDQNVKDNAADKPWSCHKHPSDHK